MKNDLIPEQLVKLWEAEAQTKFSYAPGMGLFGPLYSKVQGYVEGRKAAYLFNQSKSQYDRIIALENVINSFAGFCEEGIKNNRFYEIVGGEWQPITKNEIFASWLKTPEARHFTSLLFYQLADNREEAVLQESKKLREDVIQMSLIIKQLKMENDELYAAIENARNYQ